MNYRITTFAIAAFTVCLIYPAIRLDQEHRLLYDLIVVGIGNGLSFLVALTIVDWITRRREHDEWKLIRKLAANQIWSNLEAAVRSLNLAFAGGGQITLITIAWPNEIVPAFRKFAEELRSYSNTELGRRKLLAQELVADYDDFEGPLNEVISIHIERLIASHADRQLIEELLGLEDSNRKFRELVLNYKRRANSIEQTSRYGLKPADGLTPHEAEIQEALRSAGVSGKLVDAVKYSNFHRSAADLVARAATVLEQAARLENLELMSRPVIGS